MVILQLSSLFLLHIVLNLCKAETKKLLYCIELLFILCIFFRSSAKQRLRCGYNYQSSVYVVHIVLKCCKAGTEM